MAFGQATSLPFFIEDFMLLEDGAKIVCYMSKSHPLMNSALWTKALREVMANKPYEHLKLQGKVYFGFDLEVYRNISRSDILSGMCTKRQLLYNCTKHGGHGLTMRLSNQVQKLFTFHTFMEHHQSLLMYSRDISTRIPHIRKVL